MSENKILSKESLVKMLEHGRLESGKIVFTNGCFDIIHPGHIQYLEQARSLGDILLVGLNDDDSVRRLKGVKRPINTFNDRALMLAGLQSVSIVIGFFEDTPIELIKTINPDVLVKGGDYQLDEIVGRDYVESYGGEVLTIPLKSGYSTSAIIEKIKNL